MGLWSSSSSRNRLELGFILWCFCNWCIVPSKASIHEYKSETFIPQSNAYFFHGGSEGLYASKVHDSPNGLSTDKPLKGKSFIRL